MSTFPPFCSLLKTNNLKFWSLGYLDQICGKFEYQET
jgi:hypothetical protein